MLLEQHATAFRVRMLAGTDPAAQGLPEAPHTAFLWPTQLCSIGCAHCSFGARKSGRPELRRLAAQPQEVVDWLAEARVARLVLCGGGEPLDEPAFIPVALAGATARGIRTEIYTAGVSLAAPVDIRTTLCDWRNALAQAPFHLRLSVDHFHTERIGLDHIPEWVHLTGELVPHWKLSLRGIRVDGDGTIERIAALLDAEIDQRRPHTGRLLLRDGRTMFFERKAFVLDNRGTLALLHRRGLSLPKDEMALLEDTLGDEGLSAPIGRPFSARLTVGHRRMDLEVHADGTVNMLESQAPDLRENLLDTSWPEMRARYYRDPIMHLVALRGLTAVADLVIEGRRRLKTKGKVVPYSIQHLSDPGLRGWVTAQAVLTCREAFCYPPALVAEAVRLCALAPA